MTNPDAKTRRFAVVLGGDDTERMRGLSKRITGCDTPKQFCTMFSKQTLFGATVERVRTMFDQADVFCVLTQTHEKYYRPLLTDFEPRNRIVQPRNKGTLVSMLCALYKLREIDPDAPVAFFPSDHFISDDRAFMDAVGSAFDVVDTKPEAIVFVGVAPDAPKSNYVWIEPGDAPSADGFPEVRKIARFRSDAASHESSELMANGGVWNSSVLVGRVGALISALRRQMSVIYRVFCLACQLFGSSTERFTTRRFYHAIRRRDLSFDVLLESVDELLVLKATGFEWSDLADPDDVLARLVQSGRRSRVFPLAGGNR